MFPRTNKVNGFYKKLGNNGRLDYQLNESDKTDCIATVNKQPINFSKLKICAEAGVKFSRKVFVGGLPPDIGEDEILAVFQQFGPVIVDWPHKMENRLLSPPKGFVFLLYWFENSVQQLTTACIKHDDKLYIEMSSRRVKNKPIQVRPWYLSNARYAENPSVQLDPHKTAFVGGLPCPITAVELAIIINRIYGGVCSVGIDVDSIFQYPTGSGHITFNNQKSFMAAITTRFAQVQNSEFDKKVDIKPYVQQSQVCDKCQGKRCNDQFATNYCANIACLQYYCVECWDISHSVPGKKYHKPIVLEGTILSKKTNHLHQIYSQ